MLDLSSTLSLGSKALIHAPGVVAWAINGYAFERDHAVLRRVIVEGWPGVPDREHWSTIESSELLLNYDVGPFARRIYDKPILFAIAEGDVITLWDLEIATYHSVPSAQKELAVIPKVSHMSLYSQQDHLSRAGAAASTFIRTYLVDV